MGSVRGKHTCFDLTRVSLLAGLSTRAFTVGQTIFKTNSSKVVKNDEICSNDQHAFILFVFDSFGYLVIEVVDIL